MPRGGEVAVVGEVGRAQLEGGRRLRLLVLPGSNLSVLGVGHSVRHRKAHRHGQGGSLISLG
jgi:hypothetical protein